MSWFIMVLRKYAKFSGRSQRAEYWYYMLFYALILAVLTVIDVLTGTYDRELRVGLAGTIFILLVFVPTFAVTVRRLHDTGRSAWWLLISIVPIIGMVVLIVFSAQDGVPGSNEYGENPKDNLVS